MYNSGVEMEEQSRREKKLKVLSMKTCREPLIAGVDEAGRGPMLGPMVVAIAAIKPAAINALASLGVRDSKILSPRRRSRLKELLLRVLDYAAVRVVEPYEIDEAVRGETYSNLNYLEAGVAAELITHLREHCGLEAVYIDSPDPVAQRFGELVKRLVGGGIEVIAENDADKKYLIVSAASIIAKTERDSLVESLKASYGDFGSGYPSDPRTREWAREWLAHHGEPPPIARKSWKSWRRL